MSVDQVSCDRSGTPAIEWSAELRRHERWLRTVILVRTGEAQAVDEVFQEVAAAALAQKAPLADRSKIEPWLYQLARRQSLMYRRGQGRRRRLTRRYAESVQSPAAFSPAISPLAWLLADEQRQRIRQALARLAPRDAELLLLKYAEEWTYRDIARHLSISTSAVEARLHRARQRLRQELIALDVIEAIP